ncbi:hypothetical protein EMCG_09721 [[Emmonsia] crescens]|uniref:Uncharacterized protein n=1 Tax=[Emmonsia] crescens TaxID=73230 RepID=A0A0G2J2P6_9EURO|nr:hypothetical protein EMCG_09721 [Emmonsia crescens UAMH 3008]
MRFASACYNGYVKDNKVRHKWCVEVKFIDEIPQGQQKDPGKVLQQLESQGTAGRGIAVRGENNASTKL